MTTTVNVLHLRKQFGREDWLPPEPFGPDGWRMSARDLTSSVIVTAAIHDSHTWIHASIAHADRMPSYDDLVTLHRAVWGKRGTAYQVFAPAAEHVNIHEYALHLWGRSDGLAQLPNFGALGTI